MGSLSVALFRRGQWSINQTRGSLPSNMAPITDPVALLRHDTHPRVHSSSSSSSSASHRSSRRLLNCTQREGGKRRRCVHVRSRSKTHPS